MAAASVLSDREILAEVQSKGSVVIVPFNREQLSNCSYDVTLGEHYYAQNPNFGGRDPFTTSGFGPNIAQAWTGKDFFCPWNSEHLADYWEAKPRQAYYVNNEVEAKAMGVQVGDHVIVMGPGATILAHTQQFIGGRRNVTTMMKARSTIGRSCITVCKCAGQGDIGYTSRWVMEIQNCTGYNLVLVVGQKVAQIVFFRTGAPLKTYEKDGSYQKESSEDMDAVVRTWKPADMLPKLKRITPIAPTLPLPDEEGVPVAETAVMTTEAMAMTGALPGEVAACCPDGILT